MNSRQLYLRLMRYVLPHWRVFALSVLCTIVVAASEPAFPALLKPMLDGSFVKKDPTWMKLVPVLMIVLFVVRGVASFVSSYAINWIANRLIMDLRQAMFAKLLRLPTRYFDNASSGNLIANAAYNVFQVTDAATSLITVAVRNSLTIAGLLGWMLYLNWKLTLLALTVGPVMIVIVRLFSKRLRNMMREFQRSLGNITHVLEETIDGHKVVKIFGGQEYETRRFHDEINRSRGFNMRYLTASAANVPIVQLIAAVALASIVYLATEQSAANETTVGGFVSFITAMLMLFSPIKSLTSVNEPLQRGLAAAEVVFELIDQEPEKDEGTQPLGRCRGEIEFRSLNFTYPATTAKALDDISLKVAPGETVALVGQSGSGKTTLVNLIPRFFHPDSGQILIDGQNIEDIRLPDLRANIALVSQDVVLFNDTVRANIAYGLQNQASEADVIAAAEAAHAMEFIRTMPEGLNTLIGENGVRLSGGQRQRLAIARAILKNAPVLILDEATASLDTQSERHVQAALETLMQGRTTLVIAHRLSTIENADRIVVLQKGRIAEIGTHRELLAHDGIYANLHRIQFTAHAPSEETV